MHDRASLHNSHKKTNVVRVRTKERIWVSVWSNDGTVTTVEEFCCSVPANQAFWILNSYYCWLPEVEEWWSVSYRDRYLESAYYCTFSSESFCIQGPILPCHGKSGMPQPVSESPEDEEGEYLFDYSTKLPMIRLLFILFGTLNNINYFVTKTVSNNIR